MLKNHQLSNRLKIWYLKNKRDLPWRQSKSPYKVWLSEIILQQTQIAQGTSYYLKFLRHFPTINQLSEASEETVLKLWQGLGYYSRARNLHFTAKTIVNDYNGQFPSDFKTIKSLKGIGDYTASAIASICFNQNHAVVDGNVYRVLARIFNINTPINTNPGFKEFKLLAQELINNEDPGMHNQAMMDFGAMVCTPKKPLCHECIFNDICLAKKHDTVLLRPVKNNNIKIKKRYFNFIVWNINNTHTILEQREQKDIWLKLFQFPVIESEQLLNFKQLKNQISANSNDLSLFNEAPIVHKLTHQQLHINFWILNTNKTNSKAINWKDINQFALPKPLQQFVDNYKKENAFL